MDEEKVAQAIVDYLTTYADLFITNPSPEGKAHHLGQVEKIIREAKK